MIFSLTIAITDRRIRWLFTVFTLRGTKKNEDSTRVSRGPSIINVKIENACMSVNLQGLKFVRGETRYARILRNAHAMHAYRCSIINIKTATARLSALISTQRDGRINETSARLCAAHHRACKKLYACWRGISRVWFSYESNCNEMECATQLVNFSPFHTCLFNDSISKFVNFKFDHIYYLLSFSLIYMYFYTIFLSLFSRQN